MRQQWLMIERGRKDFADFLNVVMLLEMHGFDAETLEFAYFVAGEWIEKLQSDEDKKAALDMMVDVRERLKKFLDDAEHMVVMHWMQVNINLVTKLDRDIFLDVMKIYDDNSFLESFKSQLEALTEEELKSREL